MRFTSPRTFICAPHVMTQLVQYMQGNTFPHIVFSDQYVRRTQAGCGVYLFRSGAMLCWAADKPNKWNIATYAAGETDLAPAVAQLRVAYHLHLAARNLARMERLTQTPSQFSRRVLGLRLQYSNGEESTNI